MSNPKGWDEVDGIKLPEITWAEPRITLTRLHPPIRVIDEIWRRKTMARKIIVEIPNGGRISIAVTVVAECYDHSYEYLLDKNGTMFRRRLSILVDSDGGWEVTNSNQVGKPTYNAREYPL